MSSELRVDKIIPTGGIPSGGGGGVIQVVSFTTQTKTIANSGTTFVDTGVTATITPKFVTSKILILTYHSVTFSNFAGNGDTGGWSLRLLRGSTVIKNGSTNGSDHYISVPAESSYIVFNDPDFMQHLDSPNTTSAVTYKTQVNESNSEINVAINGNDGSNVDSSMILMEVSA
tara:strand:- start:30 stop:548 length:519 start_codon:yes stop_codon:yes gene_type:complete